jgi:hypothetical protein
MVDTTARERGGAAGSWWVGGKLGAVGGGVVEEGKNER